MGKQLGFFVDVSRCTGCRTCQVACKDKNSLEVGRNFRRVSEYAGGSWRKDRLTGAWHTDTFAYYLSVSCNECSDPACVRACPTGAHFKRAEDGLVLIDREKCVGCGACASACPYGAPQLDRKAGKMTKCDACLGRIERGLNPTCVDSCPQRAIEFGDMEELLAKHPGSHVHFAPLPDPKQTQPNLLLRAPKNAKPLGDDSGEVYMPFKN